jgi:hypothetical protein
MRSIRAAAVLLAIALAVPAVSAAQQVPNLSGTWVLQADKSDFGMAPPPQSRTDVIEHQAPKLTIRRTMVTPAAGESTVNLVYAVDGKPHKNMVGPSELTSILTWEGGTLVSVSTVDTQQGPLTITDRFTLSEDGKTLTQHRTLSAQGQEAKQTMVLVKQ